MWIRISERVLGAPGARTPRLARVRDAPQRAGRPRPRIKMSPIHPVQRFSPPLTPWHITFGTYGTRLHGSAAPTVDKQHNDIGTPFLTKNVVRFASDRNRMRFEPVVLTLEQRLFIELEIVAVCERGGWGYRICAAASDHVHLLCDVVPAVHGEKVRRLVKRWLGQALSERWPLPDGATWWAEEGSNIAIHEERYLNNCFAYVWRQRATPPASRGVLAPEDEVGGGGGTE